MNATFAHRKVSGNFLAALPISDNQVVGVSTLNELEQFGLRRPSLTEDAKVRQMANDPALKAAHELRESVQRRFDTARKKRAGFYGNYMNGLAAGSLLGGVPPITIFCPIVGSIVDGGIILQHNMPIVAIDGETQTEARFLRRDADPATGDDAVAFVLYHGISTDHAGSILHDFNKYAHPIKEAQAARLNANGSVTQSVSEAITEASIPTAALKLHKGKPKKSQIAAWPTLLSAAVAYAAPSEVLGNGKLKIADALAKYNNGANAVSKEKVKPFIVHALNLAAQDRDVACSHENVWVIVAAKSARDGKMVSLNDWRTINNIYTSAKNQKSTAARQAAGV